MLASRTTTNNTSINGQYSPCECPVISVPLASVDGTVPQNDHSIASVDETVPPKDDWKFTFGRDDCDLALDDQDCDAAFPGLFEEINRVTQFRGSRVIGLEELASIKISNGMVRAVIHGRQVISPPHVANIIDERLGVVICPRSKLSRPRISQKALLF